MQMFKAQDLINFVPLKYMDTDGDFYRGANAAW